MLRDKLAYRGLFTLIAANKGIMTSKVDKNGEKVLPLSCSEEPQKKFL
jgi:hypothetical protein